MEIKTKDKLLLIEMLKNGRQNFSKLGKTLHISRQAVFSRIKTLKNQGIIRNFTVNINQEKIGLDFKAYILMTIEPRNQSRQKINIFLKRCKQVSQAYYLFGSHDILMEVLVRNRIELSQLIKQFQKFDYVKKTVTLIVYDTIKDCQNHPFERVLEDDKMNYVAEKSA